jgi:hypothetical protein
MAMKWRRYRGRRSLCRPASRGGLKERALLGRKLQGFSEELKGFFARLSARA